jgi:glycosyltransferase involved in cell wall biosynthesis
MRIAYFSDNSYPELSGITDTILMTGAELKKKGHKVCYIGPQYSPKDYTKSHKPFPSSVAEDTYGGMPFIRLPSFHIPSPTGQSRFALPIGASFTFLHEFMPDLIHTQSPYGVGWEAIRAAQRFNIPFVGTNHTAIEDFFPLGILMRKYDASYYNHCKVVTAPYGTLLERMKESGFTQPSQVIANPADLSLFTPTAHTERTAYKQAQGYAGPVLLYVGRLSADKRVDVLLRGMALLVEQFPTITLVITGHGAAEPKLKALTIELQLTKRVRFTGFLSKEALSDVYKAADVFVFMSTSDSQSISLMQAYATGIPAVCAAARGLPDYTPNDCGFLVEPGNYKALAEKVTLLLADNALREKMGNAAAQYVARYAPPNIATLWEEVYSSAIEKSLL